MFMFRDSELLAQKTTTCLGFKEPLVLQGRELRAIIFYAINLYFILTVSKSYFPSQMYEAFTFNKYMVNKC